MNYMTLRCDSGIRSDKLTLKPMIYIAVNFLNYKS